MPPFEKGASFVENVDCKPQAGRCVDCRGSRRFGELTRSDGIDGIDGIGWPNLLDERRFPLGELASRQFQEIGRSKHIRHFEGGQSAAHAHIAPGALVQVGEGRIQSVLPTIESVLGIQARGGFAFARLATTI